MASWTLPPLEQVLGSAHTIETSRIEGDGPDGRLPLTAEMLRTSRAATSSASPRTPGWAGARTRSADRST